jgi:hypothetical protein
MLSLQFYCSKIIAQNMRENLNNEERYNLLIRLPPQIIPLIRSFPISRMDFFKEEGLLDKQFLNYYLKAAPLAILRNEIDEIYHISCEKGYYSKDVWFLSCSNYYCDNKTLSNNSVPSYNIRAHLCQECKKYNLALGYYYKIKNHLRQYLVE